MDQSGRTGRYGRILGAALAAVALATGLVGLAPTAVAAAEGPEYVTDPAPLRLDGVAYDQTFGLFARGSLIIPAVEDAEPTFVTLADTPVAGIPNASGTLAPFHAALLEMEGRRITAYVDSMILGEGPASCEGLEEAFGGGGVTCVDFAPEVLTPNGPGADFTFHGLDGFAGAVSVVPGFGDPSLRYAPGTPMPVPAGDFYASASPLTFGGDDYDEYPLDGDDGDDGEPDGEAAPRGTVWLTQSDEPTFVSDDDTPVPGVPSSYGPRPIHVALAEVEGLLVTAYIDSVYFTELAPEEIPATCAGLEELFGYFGDEPPDVTCVNFKAGIFVPGAGASALAASYTYTGLSGFEVPGAVDVVAGFSSPSLTFGPRPDGADPTDPTDPTDPDDPTEPTDPGSPEDEGAPAGDDGTAPGELPRTGSTTAVLTAIGLALVALGSGARRLRTGRPVV